MDKTEQFIKMADCPEIQEQHQPIEGDLCAIKFMGYSIELIIGQTPPRADKKDNRSLLKAGNTAWLPRQDDIQGMMIKDYDNTYTLLDCFAIFWSTRRYAYWMDMTMEQLWLAFYMHEKHQKVWLSKEEKWVKK